MKTTLCMILAFMLSGYCFAQNSGTENISINGTWSFKIDPDNTGEKGGWFETEFPSAGWDLMQVPSNWDLQNAYAHYSGKAWYRKVVSIPEKWTGKSLFLNFEGVYYNSKIWFNGQLLGANDNGFLPFRFDVSKLVKQGADNVIVVCADNTFRLGAVWNWGGIRRPVSLNAYEKVQIIQQHITPVVDLKSGTAKVSVKVFLENTSENEQAVAGEVALKRAGLLNRFLQFKALVPAHGKKEVEVIAVLKKSEVHLWHFDDPFLYDSKVSIEGNGRMYHEKTNRFGLRKIEVDNVNYLFKLNGEPVRLMGFNLVPDDRTTGNTLPLWRIKEDVDMMKEAGCNMTRLSHFPLPEEMYDYLDERGILIFPEVSLWGNTTMVDPADPKPREWLRQLIFNNYNHPSIIGWGVGNEIGENPMVMDYVSSAIKHARELDKSRLAVMVSHTASRTPDPIQYSELGLINNYGKNLSPVVKWTHKLHPDKLLFYSEYGVGQLNEDLNADFDARTVIDSLRFKPYLMGASLWTFNDYRSSFSGTKEASENRPWGIVDVFRQKKKAWFSIRKEYQPIKLSATLRAGVEKSDEQSLDVMLIPRDKLDLPAFTVRNYKLIWSLKDVKKDVLDAGMEPLEEMRPGGKNISKYVSWKKNPNAFSMELKVISPLNYSVVDTTIYFRKPERPRIIYVSGTRTQLNEAPAKKGMIRVVFEKEHTATGYKVRYGKEELSEESPVTANHYVEIYGLEPGTTYQVALIAVNAAGESIASEIQKIKVEYALAAPIVRYTERINNNVFIGYSTQGDDYQFEVNYRTEAGGYDEVNTLRSTNKGVLMLPELDKEAKYYYRIRSLKQNLYPSLWSEEVSVTPEGKAGAGLEIQKVLRSGTGALILFEPKKKAVGYQLFYKLAKSFTWASEHINAAQIKSYYLSNLKKGADYDFKMEVIY